MTLSPGSPTGGVRALVDTLETLSGGVTTPQGFRAAGVRAGIKASGPDLALVVSDRSATAAAVFTTNRVQAAPVIVSREHLARSGGAARAIIANSGCANACTGEAGVQVARTMAHETAHLVDCPPEQVLVASTGVIGVALDIDAVRVALPSAVDALGVEQGGAAARAIMTTDPFPKEAAARVSIKGRPITIGGMAKGAGMIDPMMATMLAFVTTDAMVPPPLLGRALRDGVTTRSMPSRSTASARPTTASCCSRTARAGLPSTIRATRHSRTRCGRCVSGWLSASCGAVRGRQSS